MGTVDVVKLATLLEQADAEDVRKDWSWQDVARHLAERRAEWLTAPRVDVVTYLDPECEVSAYVFLDGEQINKEGAQTDVWSFEWDTGRDPDDIDADEQAVAQAEGLPAAVLDRCSKLIGYERDAIDDGGRE